jgi:hypothetical protein
MRAIVVVATLAVCAVLAAPAYASPRVQVAVRPETVSSRLGEAFVLRTTLTNSGDTVAAGLLAHLNVVSLDGDVYVDPEDWSASRTRYLAALPAGGSTTVTWKLRAVNAGRIGVYVSVLPRRAGAAPVSGRTVQVTIADRRTLDAGGILPLALGLPALLAVLGGALAIRRRHTLRGRRDGRAMAPQT